MYSQMIDLNFISNTLEIYSAETLNNEISVFNWNNKRRKMSGVSLAIKIVVRSLFFLPVTLFWRLYLLL